jgi:hypothetical protein
MVAGMVRGFTDCVIAMDPDFCSGGVLAADG